MCCIRILPPTRVAGTRLCLAGPRQSDPAGPRQARGRRATAGRTCTPRSSADKPLFGTRRSRPNLSYWPRAAAENLDDTVNLGGRAPRPSRSCRPPCIPPPVTGVDARLSGGNRSRANELARYADGEDTESCLQFRRTAHGRCIPRRVSTGVERWLSDELLS